MGDRMKTITIGHVFWGVLLVFWGLVEAGAFRW